MTHRPGPLAHPADNPASRARGQSDLVLIGHDLRAALRDVLDGLQALDGVALDAGPRAQLGRARAAADTLAPMIEGALARAADAPLAMTCSTEPFALVALLDRIAARWSAAAAERGMTLEIDLAPGTPGLVVSDRLSLERILSNLVGNAVIHAAQGPVRLSVASGPAGGPAFTVTDAGPGFPARVLTPVTSFDLPADAAPGGGGRPGLGLFIASDLARRIGAHLMLSNLPGGGASARLALQAPARPVTPDNEPLPDLTGLHILLAEESASQRQATSALLQSMGARVTATRPGLAARALAQAGDVDAILLDAPPSQQGVEAVLAAIRATPGHAATVPLLAVIATDDAVAHAGLRAAGADGVIVKPVVCPAALGLAVLSLPAGRGQADDPDTACDPAPLERLVLLVGPAAAGDLCNRIRDDLMALRGGIARAASAPADAAALRRHAHGLVALSGTCGALGLHRSAQLLHERAERHGAGPDAALSARLEAGFADLLSRIGACAARFGP